MNFDVMSRRFNEYGGRMLGLFTEWGYEYGLCWRWGLQVPNALGLVMVMVSMHGIGQGG